MVLGRNTIQNNLSYNLNKSLLYQMHGTIHWRYQIQMNGILEIRSSLLKNTNDSRVGICESEVISSTYIQIKEPDNQNQFKFFSFCYLKSILDLIILINYDLYFLGNGWYWYSKTLTIFPPCKLQLGLQEIIGIGLWNFSEKKKIN